MERATRAAWSCLAKGKLKTAITIHQRLLAENPEPQLRNRTGDLLVRADRLDVAIALFLEVAREYERDGFLDKARAVYRKILRLDPMHRQAHGALAWLDLQRSRDYPGCRDPFPGSSQR